MTVDEVKAMKADAKANKLSKVQARDAEAIKGVRSLGLIPKFNPAKEDYRVDENLYQRGKQWPMISNIVAGLKAGGSIVDPVSLVKRLWGQTSKRSPYYVADGQQRIYAALECNVTVPAMVYEVTSEEAERQLYQKLNTSVDQTANNVCKSWVGAGVDMLREAAETKRHSLHNRVTFDNPSTVFCAAVVASGMLAAATGKTGTRGIRGRLANLDDAVKESDAAAARASAFLKLIGECFTVGRRPKILPVNAIGIVAYRHWVDGYTTMPSGRVMGAIKRISWDSVMGSSAKKYQSMFVEKVEAIWR